MAVLSEVRKGDKIELFIEKLLYGGDALSHYGTKACFISDAIPGEQIVARVEQVKSQYLKTSLDKILNHSTHRDISECQYFNLCGGCQWQHIAYSHQLYWKAEILKECLSRIAKIKNIKVPQLIPSPSSFNYRHSASLKVSPSKEPLVGYFRSRSHNIVPVIQCLLLAAPLNKALAKLPELIKSDYSLYKDLSEIEMICINHSEQVLVSLKKSRRVHVNRFLYQSTTDKIFTFDGELNDEIMGIKFKRDVKSFYQVNHNQNINMIKLVLEYFTPLNKQKILDLFCGCGNFSLFLAREGAEVVGIDSNRFSINEAAFNAKLNQINRCVFITADANNIYSHLLTDKYYGVLLNPPRSGCSKEILNKIADKKPSIIVYVSCNPATLARDLMVLDSRGYKIDKIQPLDMFPQTYHLETIVKLIRK